MTQPRNRLRTFGGLSFDLDGAETTGAPLQGRRLALLALLAANASTGVRREVLSAYLWPESHPDRARNALNQAVFSLRRDLGDGAIVVTGGEVRLNTTHVSVDVVDFEEAIAAEISTAPSSCTRGHFWLDSSFPTAGSSSAGSRRSAVVSPAGITRR